MTDPARAMIEDDGLLPVGTLVAGRFRTERLLGRGGMGAVYEAEDEQIGRHVALKLLGVAGHVAAARFAMEAHAASRISSRHAAAIHDFGEDPEHGSYIVMERLEGVSLDDALAEGGGVDPSIATAVAADIAEALGAAHAAGVVHRDLKPANVMMLSEGGLKVVDFGIAQVAEPRGRTSHARIETNPDALIGTPTYISPEVVRGDPVGPPADLYALGVILYEMIVGRPPFVDDVPATLCVMHMKEPVPAPSAVRPDVALPSGLESLVLALLEKDPALRPPAASEVAASLRAMSDVDGPVRLDATPGGGTGAATAVIPTVQRPASGLPRAALAALVAGVFLASALLAAGVAIFVSRPAPSPVASPAPPAPAQAIPAPSPAQAIPAGAELPAAPTTIELAVRTTPANASLSLDDEPVEAPITLPADGREHTLEVSARGHRSERRTFEADRDLSLEIVLERARRRARGAEGRRLPVKMREW